ncbi:MAG: Asp-tRNA(Asn)/Glu-tRNA(Gln) amidotransferase subunit GatA [Pirellulaceae bacterium]
MEEHSAVELGRKIGQGELSSRQVTEYFMDRIAASDGRINAFTSKAESALEVATAVDERVAAGETLSPLAGVPIAVKDVLCTKGVATTCGSKMLENFVPPYESQATERLLQGGLVPVGKTNMDEFAMGGSTETSFFGPTANPRDLSRTPGGSSGGAAAALAAGMAPLSVGSDTGGSVRQPAAFCGVCGLKPTYGRISRYGLVAFASSLDQVGPLANHVEDLAALLQIMAGHDPRDSTSLDAPVPGYSSGLSGGVQGLRVGLVRSQLEHEALEPSIRQGVEKAIDSLVSLGAKIVDIELPHNEYAVPAYYVVAPCEASGNLERYEGVHYGHRASSPYASDSPLESMMARSRTEGFGDEVKRRIMLGTFALSSGYYDAYYKKALQVRRLIAGDYQQAFESVDVLVGPVTPTTAYPLGDRKDDPVRMYLGDLFTVGANLAGIPALSIPAGYDSEGLPLAVQLQGPALSEDRLLRVAYSLQSAGLFTPKTVTV